MCDNIKKSATADFSQIDMASRRIGLNPCRHKLSRYLRGLHQDLNPNLNFKRYDSQISSTRPCNFGFLFDIDGVIVRGKKLLPSAQAAFKLLTDRHGKFRVPTVFVTNAGNSLRSSKAQQLSEWLKIHVSEEQVVMSHSPLKMFRQFHEKHVLVNGQGPIKEIAANIGFQRVTTLEELNQQFPNLDKMDHSRRKAAPCAFEEYFPKIEAIILFGEPVRWEVPLQLIIDVLLTNGKPSSGLVEVPYPHLPVLACNMDLLWMSEANMPRFGHGCFMNALEGLYQKVTGKELKYTALIGKPSEITYHHADYILSQQRRQLNVDHIKTIYCIGDNPETDIYGGNLYNRYLQRRHLNNPHLVSCNSHSQSSSASSSSSSPSNPIPLSVPNKKVRLRQSNTDSDFLNEESDDEDIDDAFMFSDHPGMDVKLIESLSEDCSGVERPFSCESILVCTGVFNRNSNFVTFAQSSISSHNHRDFVIDPNLTQPNHVVPNVYEAVKLVFEKEHFT